MNPLLLTDAYKLSHAEQYPQGTELIVTNCTPRSNRHFTGKNKFYDDKVVHYGLQSILKEMVTLWDTNFFNADAEEVISEFKEISASFGNFNTERWHALHELGYLPIHVKSVTEGLSVNVKTPTFTIHNTHPDFYWLVNYLETSISSDSWKMSTVATIAKTFKRTLEHFAKISGAPIEFVSFQSHDFSSRGMSSCQDFVKCGSAHLTSFLGSDSIASAKYIKDNYSSEGMIGCSVPATEHSVMCANGMADEAETFSNLINNLYPSGIVSIVSDTWDFWNVLTETLPNIKDDIMKRDGKVVIRPDSGNPEDIICGTAIPVDSIFDVNMSYFTGTKDNVSKMFVMDSGDYFSGHVSKGCVIINELDAAEVDPSVKGAIRCLFDVFGGTKNELGFNSLDSHIGLIYGDAITIQRAESILTKLMKLGFCSDCVVFGVGSYSYQYVTRDTFGYALKATYCVINGESFNIFKNPKTDSGTKKSAKGLVFLNDELELEDEVSMDKFLSKDNNLRDIFINGEWFNSITFDKIRSNIDL